MSWEVWGDPPDSPELPDGWWDDDQVVEAELRLKELADAIAQRDAEIARLRAMLRSGEISSRHPTVIRWRNDWIEACAGIADRYGYTFVAADIRVMLAPQSSEGDSQPATQGQQS